MTRDGDIPTIFNPRRVRAPSVVVTNDNEQIATLQQTNGGGQTTPGGGRPGVPNGPFTGSVQQIHHADSVTSSHPSQQDPNEALQQPIQTGGGTNGPIHRFKACSSSLCSKSARKCGNDWFTVECLAARACEYHHRTNPGTKFTQEIYFGVCVTVCVTASWVGATHCIKYLYFRKPPYTLDTAQLPLDTGNVSISSLHPSYVPYNAPFFTTWFCTNWTILFFPLYFLCRVATNRCQTPGEIFTESIRNYRDKGFTAARFLTRCSFFCILWVGTNYMYIHSLKILLATDVMALFATNVSCVYLLSWVILHEQFVGIRIVAVILCDTGIALLAYMDGINGSPTLGGVVLAASAAAGSAVYKVLFKKVIGDATYGQVAMFFSLIGLFNAAMLWPLCLTLYFTGVETLYWERLPWPALLAASILSLVANLLGNFSVALTYDLFITLGLITAVPVSAALDVVLYGAHFFGMKLAGMILIAVGFFLVMFPDNWPDYITRLLRNIIMLSHSARWSRRHRHGVQGNHRRDVVDYRTGYIRSHLRSPSGRVR